MKKMQACFGWWWVYCLASSYEIVEVVVLQNESICVTSGRYGICIYRGIDSML